MLGERAEIERGLASIRVLVVDRLSAQGWVGRDLSGGSSAAVMRTVATATLPGDNGVLVAVEVVRTSFTWPQRWPVNLAARIGVGYEPALNLMPRLTLPARPILIDDHIDDHADSGAGGLPVSLAGPGGVGPAVDQIAAWVQRRAGGLVQRYPDAAAIDAELERRLAAAGKPDPAKSDGGPKQRPVGIPDRLVLLAAMGRDEQTRTLLGTYRTEADDGSAGAPDRRFVRQLTRWLDLGSPQAPPAEQTLAVVASPPPEPRPPRKQIMTMARARTKVENEARAATRSRARGKTLEQLRSLVTSEYRARGIALPPYAVAWHAEMLQLEQRPFGRVRSAARGISMSAGAATAGIRMVLGRRSTDPDWLRPPERASFPVDTDHTHFVPIDVETSARTWIEHVQRHAPRRLGPWTLVNAWLTRDDRTGRLVVHIGDQPVGTVSTADAGRLDRAMTAAALFDEDPLLDARLSPSDDPDSTTLEISVPRSTQPPDRPAH